MGGDWVAERVPARIRVAVDVVDAPPDARLLEIGCGTGVAMALMCQRLVGGHITGLDRSATAIARAEKRVARYLDEGVADLHHRDVAVFHGDGRPFDVVFAVNVNVFWSGRAEVETSRLRDLVKDFGRVHLFYETPPGVDGHRAGRLTSSALASAGFGSDIAVLDGVVCVTGRPRAL